MRAGSAVGAALATLALVAGTAPVAAAGPGGGGHAPDGLAGLRASTATLHSIAVAERQGYGLLLDARGIACIDMPGMGGMGVHWANTALVGDPEVVPDSPEALVYAPMRDGTPRLAAVEYVVTKAAWDATHGSPPELFGHRFDLTPEPNRFGLPTFYSLHVWVWERNPAGTFQMWNPRVVCPGT